MENIKNKLQNTQFVKHETKRNVLTRFFIVLVLFLLYFIFVSFEYGAEDGLLVTLITWSFFVFCTPIADAGFLIDFPVRVLTRIKMFYSEILVWIIGILINLYALTFVPEVYSLTHITMVAKTIYLTPIPYWSIILLSFVGTFLSVYFGDELIDVIKHKERLSYLKHKKKHNIIIGLFALLFVFILYVSLITDFGLFSMLF